MKTHSIFLRKGCTLPSGNTIPQSAFCDGWTTAEGVTAPALDKTIRDFGWHFMWLSDASSCRGLGRTAEGATHNAILRSLRKVNGRFNAAEMGRVYVTHFWPFCSASVRLYSRQIQQQASLGPAH